MHGRLVVLLVGVITLWLLVACRAAPTPTPPPPTKAPATPVTAPSPTPVLPSPTPALLPTPTPTLAPPPTPAVRVKTGGTVTIVENDTGGDPLGMDPHATFTYRTHRTLSFPYSTLLNFPWGPQVGFSDFTPTVEQALAEKWEWKSPTHLVVNLRKGVRFHNKPPVNGRELTAEDVKWSYERMLNSTFTYRDILAVVESITTPDKYTLEFKLSEPQVDFLVSLANHYNWILAKEAGDYSGKEPFVQKWGDFRDAKTVIGTGPFMLESYEPNVRNVWKRHPDYFWKPYPYVDTVIRLDIRDPATRLASLRAGKLDWISPQPTEMPTLQQSEPNYIYRRGFPCGGPIFYFRNDKPPFNNLQVRRAMSLAFDREGWLKSFFVGQGTMINGPGIMACHGDLQLPIEQLGPASQWFKYDVERAKQMMAQAGYGAGFEVEFLGTAGYGPIWVSEMEFIAANMAKIGIKLNIKLVEYAEWLVTGHAGLYKDTAFGPMTPYLSIDEWTYGMLNSGSAANKCHCNDPKLDELTLKQRRTFDPKERRAVLEELQRYVHDQVVYIMPPLGYTNYAAREWVRDFYPKGGYHEGTYISRVWLER